MHEDRGVDEEGGAAGGGYCALLDDFGWEEGIVAFVDHPADENYDCYAEAAEESDDSS